MQNAVYEFSLSQEAYVEGFLHRSLKMTPAQFDACSRLVEDIYQHYSAVVSDQIAVRHLIAKELEKIVKTVLPGTLRDNLFCE